jgi:S1-C subfamily serine protease
MNGGAASAAGIKVGATITKLNGTAITSGAQLRALLAKASPGDSATVTWKTARGVTRSATLQLGTAPIA